MLASRCVSMVFASTDTETCTSVSPNFSTKFVCLRDNLRSIEDENASSTGKGSWSVWRENWMEFAPVTKVPNQRDKSDTDMN